MAHKHNRRRVRPRNRDHSPSNPAYDMLDDSSSFSESSVDLSTSCNTTSKQPFPSSIPRNIDVSVASKHWHNRYTAWQNRETAQKREAVNIEAEQFKLFGGVPGDDVGLCFKMLEVFEGMNWIE